MSKTGGPRVGIVLGSESDLPMMTKGVELLKKFGVEVEVELSSAHRAPEKTARYAREAESRGLGVLIGAAGFANHLAGSLAAHTVLPVIGVPLNTSALNGLDSLLSTVQMPEGVPVATVSIGEAGAVNAAVLALQILATADPSLRQAIRRYKEEMAEKIARRAEEIRNLP
ncbi:MAG TPA: 5-(carboxyamino)imidazole ribonucleotide mutase [Candidatus Polarisedimenticolia bacterium]|nr:5-(carboxyamino)imidazole ribonucleotide mutase [Candidatus Polarisedimenticolia bacterium]